MPGGELSGLVFESKVCVFEPFRHQFCTLGQELFVCEFACPFWDAVCGEVFLGFQQSTLCLLIEDIDV